MKCAVLSNINIDPLKYSLTEVGINEHYFSGYNQYLFEFINEQSELNTNYFDLVFLHLDSDEFLVSMDILNNEEDIKSEIQNVFSVVERYIKGNQKTLIMVSNMPLSPYRYSTYIKQFNLDNYFYETISTLSETYPNLILFDFARLISLYGYKKLFTNKYWYLGRIKYTDSCFKIISLEIQRHLNAYQGKSRKLLILDLDNTLWGGVIGEDGLENIKLGEEGVGKIYRDFQKIVVCLKHLGVLLAICSKNNEKDAVSVFNKHSMMVLKYDDFVSKKVNWKDKASNLLEIAIETNLGLDSFVFIDDNAVERQYIKETMPEVAVPSFPKNIVDLNTWFLEDVVYNYFSRLRITSEDRDKTQQYKRRLKRNILANELDLKGFIKSLDIKIILKKNDIAISTRLAQLTQKTNQFNLTTRRYDLKDIVEYIKSPDIDVWGLEYTDKFGHEGIVGEAIVKINDDVAVVDTYLLSCRIIGRDVEYIFFKMILCDLSDRGVSKVVGEYIESKKNSIVKEFYCNCGMEQNEKGIFKGDIESLIKKLQENE